MPRYPLIAAAIFMMSITIPAAARSDEPRIPRSVKVDLPADAGQFPGGAEADAINNNCLACHSADMVLNQPAFPRSTWEAEVKRMITAYHAPVDAADAARIVDYLAKTKGARGQN